MKSIPQPYSYNLRAPRELKMFIEMIIGVYRQYEDVKWSGLSDNEIGFYYRDKKSKCEFFFGIWYDLWEKYEIPLSITFEYNGPAPIQWHDKIKKNIHTQKIQGLRIENFQGYTCILFEYEYFKFDSGDDISRLSILYQGLIDYACSISES